jgi:hypothetical protein
MLSYSCHLSLLFLSLSHALLLYDALHHAMIQQDDRHEMWFFDVRFLSLYRYEK